MNAPRIPSMFKTPQHKRFSLTPRYYNPEEEERKARLQKLKEKYQVEGNSENKNTINHVKIEKGWFNNAWRTQGSYKSSRKSSNIRVFIILFVLLAIIYLFFKF